MAKYKKERWPNADFVALSREWFRGEDSEYLDLSVRARMVYICIKSAYLPGKSGLLGNNGQITFSYDALKKGSGFNSDTTISNAIRELEEKGWILITERGGLFRGLSKYEITGRFDRYI